MGSGHHGLSGWTRLAVCVRILPADALAVVLASRIAAAGIAMYKAQDRWLCVLVRAKWILTLPRYLNTL
jgi:hypothetical protein